MSEHHTWREMRKRLSELSESVDGALRKMPGVGALMPSERPAVNIYEADDELIVCAEVPGVCRESLEVSQKGRTLVLRGKDERCECEGLACLLKERGPSEFSRELVLPVEVDEETEPVATLRDGLLTLRLKKRPASDGRSIEIQTESPQ